MIELFLGATPSMDIALAGYTGLLNIPTAEVRADQDLALAFHWLEAPRADLILSPPDTGLVNRAYTVTLAALPFLETTVAALSVDNWPDPGFPIVPNGFHRAAMVKFKVPVEWPGPSMALGVVDPLSANLFNGFETTYGLAAYYAVATQRLGPLALTAGWGAGDRRPARYARLQPFLDGAFGGLAWALPFGFEAMAEWDARSPNAGLRWTTPWGLSLVAGRLGGGWTAGAALSVKL